MQEEIKILELTERQRNRLFKIRLVEILEKQKIGTAEQLSGLRELIDPEDDPVR